MKLYVVRHGPAEDAATSGTDSDRALTASGRERVRAVAKTLVALDEAPRLIVSSPLVRAVQTAEIVATAAGRAHPGDGAVVRVRREMAPGGPARALARELVAVKQKRVMLVGHEPDLSLLVGALLGSFDRGFDKAMVVGIHLPSDGRQARLRFVLDPKTLRIDPDERRVH